ncbi:hypothetical protein [Clostridium sp. LS]|nr:hypothetical protein [Clostridium sp. LS]
MAALVAGGVMSILKPGLNIFLYVCVILITIYSLIDIFYKAV